MITKISQATRQLGITSQLYTNRMNQLLGEHALNNAQFGMLNHLARERKPHTLTDLTAVMELNQPAVSKIVSKFLKAGWASVTKDQQDSRKKWVTITPKGERLVGEIMQSIGPDVSGWFDSWSQDDIDQLSRLLGKLNHWLDQNRLT